MMLNSYIELLENNPNDFLAYHIKSPTLLLEEPSILDHLVEQIVYGNKQAYYSQADSWAVFQSREFENFVYEDESSSLDEDKIAEHLERLYRPLIDALVEFGDQEVILIPLVNLIQSISLNHLYSSDFPLHHLPWSIYLDIACQSRFQNDNNQLTAFFIDQHIEKPLRFVKDLQYYLAKGLASAHCSYADIKACSTYLKHQSLSHIQPNFYRALLDLFKQTNEFKSIFTIGRKQESHKFFSSNWLLATGANSHLLQKVASRGDRGKLLHTLDRIELGKIERFELNSWIEEAECGTQYLACYCSSQAASIEEIVLSSLNDSIFENGTLRIRLPLVTPIGQIYVTYKQDEDVKAMSFLINHPLLQITYQPD